MENNMTTKIFPSFTKAMDAETGIVEAYVSVFGIMDQDDPPDIIELGAFAKTIQERGPAGARKIRVLRQHRWTDVIGMPLAIVEHSGICCHLNYCSVFLRPLAVCLPGRSS